MKTKKELLDIARDMLSRLEQIEKEQGQAGMCQVLMNYDLSTLLSLLVAWFEADCNADS
jgi:hypothetical protein